jgi:hypothetical protein
MCAHETPLAPVCGRKKKPKRPLAWYVLFIASLIKCCWNASFDSRAPSLTNIKAVNPLGISGYFSRAWKIGLDLVMRPVAVSIRQQAPHFAFTSLA